MALCEHCLLEVPPGTDIRDDDGRLFCCQGCRAVSRFIRGEGLLAFYRRREWKAGEGERPSPGEVGDEEPYRDRIRERGGKPEVELFVEGIRCSACVWLVEQVLRRTPGVTTARVNYVTHQAAIGWDPRQTGLREILARIVAAGYLPRPYSPSAASRARREESRGLLMRLGTAAFLSAQIMTYSLALYAGYFEAIDSGTKRLFGSIALLLTIPVLAYAAGPIFRSAAAGLRNFVFTMDTLAAIGSGSAFLAGAWGLLSGGEVYFDTAAMIVTFVLLGRYLESRARERAGESIERLAELDPRTAVRVTPTGDGQEDRRVVSISTLRIGDLVETRPGEKFATDGIVRRGESSADESLLTGEPIPVPKVEGSRVIGGSLNGRGSVVFEVVRVGAETILARILKAAEQAHSSRPPLQGIADRVVGRVVPFVLALAALTAAGHLASGRAAEQALLAAVSVVVITCPCSVGLAAPLAMLHCLGRASARGVLVRDGAVVERASHARTVVLDKTGTLTEGAPALRDVRLTDPRVDRQRCLRVAASLEARSEHLFGPPLAAAGGGSLTPVTDFSAHPGKGVAGTVDGTRVLLGSRAWMTENGIDLPPIAPPRGTAEGFSTVCLAWGGRLRALFLLSDTVRAEAEEAVDSLRVAGLRVLLISGDSPEPTAAAAARVGIATSEAEATPERKREVVAGIQAGGEAVVMAGDGINDAPALAEAAVGVAVSRGIDAARESAGVVLMRNDLRLLPWFLALSRSTFRIIRQNFFWAFVYNAAALPVAMAGLLHPIVAAGAMAASSSFVVLNSRRVGRG